MGYFFKLVLCVIAYSETTVLQDNRSWLSGIHTFLYLSSDREAPILFYSLIFKILKCYRPLSH